MAEYNEIEFNGLLSKDEFFKLIEAVRRDGAIDETEAEKLVDWAMDKLTGAELVKLMINGFLKVETWAAGCPNVVPTAEAMEFMGAVDANQIPMVEESYVS